MNLFQINGIKLIVEDDLIVSKIMSENKVFEKETTEWILSNLEKDKTFVDVGHSTGWFSLQVSLKGYKVIAFEPMSPAYSRAKENMKINNLNYMLYNEAVSDKNSDETKIYYNPNVPITTGASLDSGIRSSLNKKFFTIKTVRLDDVIEKENVGIIKIDVEGHELSVLRGAQKIINKNRPKLILEANDKNYEETLAKWLSENHYAYRILDERNMICETM
jgi:FkbM family methyltransferase